MGDERLGRYRLCRRLATGGMAEVFAGVIEGPAGFEKPVAIKRILPHLSEDEEFVEMFREEARLASRLSHANIAQIVDFDVIGGRNLLVMEWVHGKDLRVALREATKARLPPSPALAAHIAREVAQALHHAHMAPGPGGRPLSLVHRDVSPQNILLSFAGEVKLTDFGIAKAATSSIATAVGIIKGKSAYMSPEQARGEVVDARSDVFALGAVLWESLTGRRLFTGDSETEILRAVQTQKAPAPSSILALIPEELDTIVLRALEKDREHRYQGAAEIEEHLACFLLQRVNNPREIDLSAWLKSLFDNQSVESRDNLLATARTEAFPKDAACQPYCAEASLSRRFFSLPPPETPPSRAVPNPHDFVPEAGRESKCDLTIETADLPANIDKRRQSASGYGLMAAAGVLACGAAMAALWPTTKEEMQEVVTAEEQPDESESSAFEEPRSDDSDRKTSEEQDTEASISKIQAIETNISTADDISSTSDGAAEPAGSKPAETLQTKPTSSGPPARQYVQESATVHEDRVSEKTTRRSSGVAMITSTHEKTVNGVESRVTDGLAVPSGALLSARLTLAVDTGACSAAEARLVRSYVMGGRVVLPRGTLLSGQATADQGRVMILFDTVSLPSGSSRKTRASAIGRDGRTGLPALDALTRVGRGEKLEALTLSPGTKLEVILEEELLLD